MKPGRFLVAFLTVIGLTLGIVFVTGAQVVEKYTVQSGDTLWSISQKFYGDKNLWPKLWEMNQGNVQNPHRLCVGDVLTIYPADLLTTAHQPPPPPTVDRNLYDRGNPLDTEYPKYFTFVADPRGIAGTGVNRIKVKKIDPLTRKTLITYDEIREVGQIISSTETGYIEPDVMDRNDREDFHGKQLLSQHDDVIVRFSEDVAKILDSATHEDPDPYFREFPIYGINKEILEPDRDRHDTDAYMGNILRFKGVLTVVARVETLAPMTEADQKKLTDMTGTHLDNEPVSYVGKITYSEDSITIGDRIFLFKNMFPGPDRDIGAKKLHGAGQYQDFDQP